MKKRFFCLLFFLFGCFLLVPLYSQELKVFLTSPENLGTDSQEAEELSVIIERPPLRSIARAGMEGRPEETYISDYTVILSWANYIDSLGYLHLFLTASDKSGEKIFFGTLGKARVDITLFNTLSSMIGELFTGFLSIATNWISGLSIEPIPLAKTIRITSPDEGAEILIGGGIGKGIVLNGESQISIAPLAAGTPLYLEVKKPGYRGYKSILILQPEKTEITLPPLVREMRFTASLSWSAARLAGAGVGARFFIIPDWLFLGFEQYIYGLPSGTEPGLTLHSDSSLFAGSYIFFPPENRLRTALSMGFIAHVSRDLLDIIYTDFSFNFLSLSAEYALPWFIPYLQIELYYTFKRELQFFYEGGHPSITAGIYLPLF